MTRFSARQIAVALGVSLALHTVVSAALLGSFQGEPVLVAGGEGLEATLLGNSFEDLATAGGVLQPVEGDEAEPTPPEEPEKPVEIAERMIAQQVERETVPPMRPPETARPVETPREPLRETAAPILHPLEGSTDAPALAPGEIAALPAAPEGEKSSLPESAATVTPPPAGIVAPAPAEPVETEAVIESVEQAEKIEPIETARLTVEVAKPLKEEGAPTPVEKPKKKTQAAKPKKQASQGPGKGAADRDAIRGSVDGAPEAVATSKAKGPGPTGPGNASVSNYPGQVYAKIRRTRQKRVGGRGVVRVAFTITASGGLGTVSVSKGSGAATINQAAIDHVRRSAPFPAPPPGAQTKFVILIEVRG